MGILGGRDVMWKFSAVSDLPGSRYGIKLGLMDPVKVDGDHRLLKIKLHPVIRLLPLVNNQLVCKMGHMPIEAVN